jgi:apolipoprotein N-acyltransferase
MRALELGVGGKRAAATWGAAVLSAALLELPFPLAGPLPVWRAAFAWFGLVPLLWAVLQPTNRDVPDHPYRRAFLVSYLCGVLWYMGNCYWIYATMHVYGGLPAVVSVLLLIAFSLVLGTYFGLFGLGLAMVRRKTGSAAMALAFAPFLWTGLDLAAARITSVPWDQLGYSQVDNQVITQLAPWTGTYGVTFFIVAVNALIAGARFFARRARLQLRILAALVVVAMTISAYAVRRNPATANSAVLIQPNLNVGEDNAWNGESWDRNIEQFARLASEPATRDTTYIAGIPQTSAPMGQVVPPPWRTYPDLVVWPESPAPFMQGDPRLEQALKRIALQEQSPVVIGGIGAGNSAQEQNYYNSAMVAGADGRWIGRYDKIHLVPFGEYIPFQNLLTFAHKLTGRVSSFSRGEQRRVFYLSGPEGKPHRYGVFICYESVFADEVRHFAKNGAEVLVNISDDGWYGDTSAPWQHLNMARMRAIENRRWLLRDTNNGVTASIDPYGRVRQSIARHQVGELPAQFAFNADITFYSAHGDVFAWLCAILSVGVVVWSLQVGAESGSRRKVTR